MSEYRLFMFKQFLRKVSKFRALKRNLCMVSWWKLIYDFISFSLNVSQGKGKLIAWRLEMEEEWQIGRCALLEATWTAALREVWPGRADAHLLLSNHRKHWVWWHSVLSVTHRVQTQESVFPQITKGIFWCCIIVSYNQNSLILRFGKMRKKEQVGIIRLKKKCHFDSTRGSTENG